MKKIVLVFLFVFVTKTVCQSQEWMTSLEVAKSLAYVQDKLLFVIWEDASYESYPVAVINEYGIRVITDLFANETINETIWKYFVPVVISEQNYSTLFSEIKDKRNQTYIDKFNDDTIKIMDVNGYIINTTISYYDYLDIEKFISKYAMNTSFLKTELGNYRTQQDFNTAYRLASKYSDFAVLVDKNVKSEIIKLSDYYLKDAELFLENDATEALIQKVELQRIKQSLVLGKAKKVLRQLKRMDIALTDNTNDGLIAFLYFTSYALLKDENNASVWRSKVSLVNLKKANLIVKNNS